MLPSLIDWSLLGWCVSQFVCLALRSSAIKNFLVTLLLLFFLLLLHIRSVFPFVVNLTVLIIFLYSRDSWTSWVWLVCVNLLFLKLSSLYFIMPIYIIIEMVFWNTNKDNYLLLSFYSVFSLIVVYFFKDIITDIPLYFLLWQILALLKSLESKNRSWLIYLWLVSFRIIFVWLVSIGAITNIMQLPLASYVALPVFLSITGLPWIISEDQDLSVPRGSGNLLEILIISLTLSIVTFGFVFSIFWKHPYIIASFVSFQNILLVFTLLSMLYGFDMLFLSWLSKFSTANRLRPIGVVFWVLMYLLFVILTFRPFFIHNLIVRLIAGFCLLIFGVLSVYSKYRLCSFSIDYSLESRLRIPFLSYSFWKKIWVNYSVGCGILWNLLRTETGRWLVSFVILLVLFSYGFIYLQ